MKNKFNDIYTKLVENFQSEDDTFKQYAFKLVQNVNKIQQYIQSTELEDWALAKLVKASEEVQEIVNHYDFQSQQSNQLDTPDVPPTEPDMDLEPSTSVYIATSKDTLGGGKPRTIGYPTEKCSKKHKR